MPNIMLKNNKWMFKMLEINTMEKKKIKAKK